MSKDMENKKYDITDEQLAAWLDENLPEDEDVLVTEALENDAYLREIVEASLDVEDKLFVNRLREIYRGKGGEDDGDVEGGGLHPVLIMGPRTSRYDWGARLVQLKQNEMAEGQDEDYGRRAANADEERKSRKVESSEKQSSSGTLAVFIMLALLAVLVIGFLMYHGVAEEQQKKDEQFNEMMERMNHWGDSEYGSYSSPVRGMTVNITPSGTSKMLWPTDGYMNHSRSEDFTFKWNTKYSAIVDVELDGKQLSLITLDSKTNSYTISASKLKSGYTMQWKITFTDPDNEDSYEGLVRLYDEVGISDM